MPKAKIVVTDAQVEAARMIVDHDKAVGRETSQAIRKIADARVIVTADVFADRDVANEATAGSDESAAVDESPTADLPPWAAPARPAFTEDQVLALVEEAWGSMADAPTHVREFAQNSEWDVHWRYDWISDYIRRDPAQQARARRRRQAGDDRGLTGA